MAKKVIISTIIIIIIGFFAWRFLRPMHIFVVDDQFAWPVDTSQSPAVLGKLTAKECGTCHEAFYKEWQTAIHSQAWTDPYFQTDWNFDGRQHVCRLCHTPLDRQQPHKVLGYSDADKWYPVLEDNPDFDSKLQHEGVTCAACHYREGKIVGVLGTTNAPHPVKKMDDPNQVCVRCHVVEGDRWDTFFRFPPCGTVAEIGSSAAQPPSKDALKLLASLQPLKEDPDIFTQMSKSKNTAIKGSTGENIVEKTSSLGCVQCHMPRVNRPLVEGGKVRQTRHHYWRGGHDPEMVKKALSVKFSEQNKNSKGKRSFALTIANTGASHYVPTGTPDRYLLVQLRVLDSHGNVLAEKSEKLIRTVMWRPFIVDLWDTRLPRWQPQTYSIDVDDNGKAASVEVLVRYYLLDEKRRKRIDYKNKTPVSYDVFRQKISLTAKLKEIVQ
ncbi:hypothetical protein MNBD_GAMMA23-847 [hydrothermal vent metagenome]|uniref:Uncharacterized protein n=1 Tax=hydrothermal vent metagenome TaxID=652676 RepID=A0A3B1A0D1_9ZZZZ